MDYFFTFSYVSYSTVLHIPPLPPRSDIYKWTYTCLLHLAGHLLPAVLDYIYSNHTLANERIRI